VTLYTISPKTFPPEVEFKPVPWVLGTYLAFTLFRIAIAMRGRLPGWFVSLSIVADMALLMLTIWSFHPQYMQPASFYLKAPTLLYVFIFIALRALRYEVLFILLASGAAALGWLFMVLNVVIAVPGDTMITRDYVAYLTSNSILLGAEFDKIIFIIMVTAILAMAVARAGFWFSLSWRQRR
jgi:adenylate cyclase